MKIIDKRGASIPLNREVFSIAVDVVYKAFAMGLIERASEYFQIGFFYY